MWDADASRLEVAAEEKRHRFLSSRCSPCMTSDSSAFSRRNSQNRPSAPDYKLCDALFIAL
jgi:hypothetical protein